MSAHYLKRLVARMVDHAPWLVDLYRAFVNPRWELANWRDYVATRRQLRWLRQIPPPPAADAPAALIVLRREDIFDIKSSLMLGAGLKLRDVRPIILANHPRVPRIRRYASAFGVDSLRYRSDFVLSESERYAIGELAAELMAQSDDLAAVRRWTYRGHRLGDRVLSTLIRRTVNGEPDLTTSVVRLVMRRILLEVLTHYHQAEKVLAAVQPKWILADETGYAANGPLVDVALSQGRDVIEASPFLREGTLVLKRMNDRLGRASAASVSRRSFEQLQAAPWRPELDAEIEAEIRRRYRGRSSLQRMYQWNTRDMDRSEICQECGLDTERPVVVVFSHVLWDASFFYGDDLFLSYGRWLEETLLAAVSNRSVNWLFKTHPSNAFRIAHGDVAGPVGEVELIRRRVGELPPHVRLLLPDTPISSISLYRNADIGITVRGTPGLEMACFGKPVLTAGTGHYSGFGFTLDSRSRDEYLERLRRIETFIGPLTAAQRTRARRYAYALFKLRPWVARSFELLLDYPEQGWNPLDRNVVPVARSLDESARFGDLERWAEWAANSDESDYLERDVLEGLTS